MRQSFTLGTTPPDLIKKKLPAKYKMELNPSDMQHLLEVLKYATFSAGKFNEWACTFRTDILETLDIEEI